MDTITLQDIKTRGSKAIPKGKVVYLIVNSKVQSVCVPPEQYEMMIDTLEEWDDMRQIEMRKHEKTLSWGEVFPGEKQ